MKWVALAIVLAAFLPLASWLRRNPRETPKVWMLMGILPFGVGTFHLLVAPISWAVWPGYVHGAEITAIDVIAAAFYVHLPRAGNPLPFRLSMALYFTAVVASAVSASVPVAAFFYVWQLARMFLVYAVVARASAADERVAPALLTGMAIGLCFEAFVTIWQRFGLGITQTGGTMGHQNMLGLMSHFVIFPWMALLLAGQRGWQPALGPLAGAVVAALTASRATVGLAGIGYAGLFFLSATRKWTGRKGLVLGMGVGAIALLAPLILSSFERRFEEQAALEGNYDERAAFQKAAENMLSEHPFGVGPNNYVVVANTDGYNAGAGVATVVGSESANVHNIYLLIAAESGYLGMLTFVLMMFRPLIVAFHCGWRARGDRRGDLLLGLGTTILVVCIHSYFEWVFIDYPAQYMFALEAGLVAGLAEQLGYWRHAPLGIRAKDNRAIGPAPGAARN